jgi:hypothetical protein
MSSFSLYSETTVSNNALNRKCGQRAIDPSPRFRFAQLSFAAATPLYIYIGKGGQFTHLLARCQVALDARLSNTLLLSFVEFLLEH